MVEFFPTSSSSSINLNSFEVGSYFKQLIGITDGILPKLQNLWYSINSKDGRFAVVYYNKLSIKFFATLEY